MAGEHTWETGQEVFEPSRGWTGFPGRVLTIDRVTPSGRAVIGPNQYDRQGRRLGGRYGDRITPFTADHQAAINRWKRRQEALNLVDAIKWRDLDEAQIDLALPVLRALIGAPS